MTAQGAPWGVACECFVLLRKDSNRGPESITLDLIVGYFRFQVKRIHGNVTMPATTTIGLDLGSNSIGWALIETGPGETGRIIATGVRVFPEGVDRDTKGTEVSKNEARRIARGMRRQIARRARRKRYLRRALVQAGLLPNVALLERNDPTRVQWEREQFKAATPYELRTRGLRERLEPHEIGRVFLHLNQRRGFLSNRKGDRAKKKETSDLLHEISQLAAELGNQTLGAHLQSILSRNPLDRVRGKHTRRDMLVNEFDAIWAAQASHHPKLLTDKLKYGSHGRMNYPAEPSGIGKGSLLERFGIYGIVFFQRPMYWPKSVVGQCELEPKLKRCPRADRRAQRFRLLHEVNNLRILDANQADERPLSSDEREKLLKVLARKKELKFTEIKKQLGLFEGARFNLERGERDKLLGMPTDATLASKKLFDKGWHERPEEEKNEIVLSLLNDEEQTILEKATSEWGVNPETAEELVGVDLVDGYASYSVTAIEKLLPHLEIGLPLMTRDGTPCAMSKAGYLRPDQRVVNQRNDLPAPPHVTNPLVRQALFEVRKLINAIIREYGMPNSIHIELAREVKGTAKDRDKRTKEMAERRRERENAAKNLREKGFAVTHDAIDRYLLWEEQKFECVYSGKPISINQLLGGEIHVDHVLPYSRSLDNSLMNRVVCFRDENDMKGDKTPHEWLAKTQPAKFDAILQRAARLSYGKARKFRVAKITLDDFIKRQLVDTAYISRQVVDYVRCLGVDVVCSKGQNTAELRYHWGLNTVLRDDGLDLKNREDHRHHAVDAIVIALTDRSRLQQLSRIRHHGGTEKTGEVLPDPWKNFREAVENAVNAINVSHKVQRKVRGALHEETAYGPTQKHSDPTSAPRPWARTWIEKPSVFVYRKPLEALTLSMVDEIRDDAIRRIVQQRLEQFGVSAGGKKGIPKEVWKEPLRMPSGVVIKKVRLLKDDRTIQPVRNNAVFVKPGSLHHLCIFEFKNERGKPVREAVFVSMLEAVERLKRRDPLISKIHPKRPDAQFVMSLSRGETVLASFDGKHEKLVRFITAASTTQQMLFAVHTDARMSAELRKFSAMPKTLHGRKVLVDVLGRLRWAND